MNTQKIISNYLEFLDSKQIELNSFKRLAKDQEKLKALDDFVEDFATLINIL